MTHWLMFTDLNTGQDIPMHPKEIRDIKRGAFNDYTVLSDGKYNYFVAESYEEACDKLMDSRYGVKSQPC